MNFDEPAFLASLIRRPEHSRLYARLFRPEWLETPELIPVLQEVYDFTTKHQLPPDVPTLHRIFKDRDEGVYKTRFKVALDRVAKADPTPSEMVYVLETARRVAVIRSFQSVATSQEFLRMETDFEADALVSRIQGWMNQFTIVDDEDSVTLREAIERVLEQHAHNSVLRDQIPCGIAPLDKWTRGGIRPGNVAVIMSPTGHGKSAALLNIWQYVGSILELPAWLVTNELDVLEYAERGLARLTNTDVWEVAQAPAEAYEKAQRHWTYGLDERLRLSYFNKEISTDELEASMLRWWNLDGWKPRVLLLDYMERMRPNLPGYKREQEWQWLGAIARDLMRFAKKHGILVWTACQTNRLGTNAEFMETVMAQGSIRHFQEAALVAGMNQREIEDGRIGLQFQLLKSRHSRRTGHRVILEADLEKMYISNQEVKVATVERPTPEDGGKRRGKKKADGPSFGG